LQRSLIVEKVLSAASSIARKHANCKHAVLNDLATALYGLVKPIDEARFIVETNCAEEVVGTLLGGFGVEEHYSEAISRLREQGLVAVSTRFYPLLVIEIARSPVDFALVESAIDVQINGYVLRIPRPSHLVAKMASLNMYPYVEYACSLLASWIKRLDLDEVIGLLLLARVDLNKLAEKLSILLELLQAFPEYESERTLLAKFVEELKSRR